MKIIKLYKNYSVFLITFCLLTTGMIYCQDDIDTVDENTEEVVLTKQEEPTVVFNYDNEDLINIINSLATLKNVNIILPPGEGINTKLTLHMDQKLTLTEGWDLLLSILDIAGFTMVPKDKTIRIIKNPSKEISREPMPTYIGVSLDEIPQTDQYIRYLGYLANIKVSDAPENELNGILKDLLPENTLYKADSVTNSLLLVAKANDIHAVMKIIIELDTVGFQEKVDIVSLHHTSAGIVAQLLMEQILKVESANPYRLDTKKQKEMPYFSSSTKVIPEERLNKLIILGRAQAVERLKDFIKKYIDVAPDSGESILHIYQLQYLAATEFVPVLNNIIQGSRSGGPSQARGGEKTVGGVERFFDEVLIFADRPSESEELKYYGGNKLVVAARNDDWRQIKKLIEELDTPQPQVLLEILIADLTIDDARQLGAMTRTPAKIPLPDQIGFQAANLANPLPNQLPNPTTINSDLLSQGYNADGSLANPTPGVSDIANFATIGTTLLSLNDNDGKTWSILELLQAFTHSKILSHPHIVATNNKMAEVTIGEQRLLPDAVSGAINPVVSFKEINADLKVKITPRISAANTVNLQILIDINEFIGGEGGQNAQTVRKLETNANVRNGGIFALGGLIRTNTTNSINETPFLNRIPVLGWFFKNRTTTVAKNNLTVFICPTIIEPRLRSGINKYTQDYIDVAKNYSTDDMFGSLKDPVTRWFFKSKIDSVNVINEFTDKNIDELDRQNNMIENTTPIASTIVLNDEQQIIAPLLTAENSPDTLENLKEKLQTDPNPFLRA